jgi:DNA-binding CsgD family transcriptional regulator
VTRRPGRQAVRAAAADRRDRECAAADAAEAITIRRQNPAIGPMSRSLVPHPQKNPWLSVGGARKQAHFPLRGKWPENCLPEPANDVLIRQRYFLDRDFSDMPEIEKAVLADLEHLKKMAERVPPQPVQNGQARTTASDRRAEVVRLLSNVDTSRLSDREIGRRIGVSPQTVGNIRRKHEASISA